MNALFQFRDTVAEKLEEVCDEGTAVDMGRSSGLVETGDIWVTVDGVDYHVQIERVRWSGED
ncbi:MAG: hypothetical protein ACMZ66_05410 [Thalassospira sp.]|uniref:hypothetical protein n=1 Tax=Thalassospira sp. TaxID=1912094 RepID=UPI003A8944F8